MVDACNAEQDGDDKPGRDEAVKRIGAMPDGMVERVGRNEMDLAPSIAVDCPDVIAGDGRLGRGGQNLPGNWEQKDFDQPDQLRAVIPCVGGLDTMVVM